MMDRWAWREDTGKGLRAGGFPLALLAACLLASGCGNLVGTTVSTAPAPPAEPPIPSSTEPAPTRLDPVLLSDPTPGPVTTAPLAEAREFDPILDSPWAQREEMEAEVQRWIESFQGREAPLFRTSLERMGLYRQMVAEHLRSRGLPASLAFLPVVESWYNPRAVSRVGAAGLWQFMPPTARGLGLNVDRLVDERRDPYLSTPKALAYLSDLHQQFGSWFLALAAYNSGPGRMDRILRRYAEGEIAHDGLFMEVLEQLPRETRNFVPRFLAAARVGRDPAAYGFSDVVPETPFPFDEVEVPDATSLDVVARASRVDQQALEELNPHLLRGLTPAGVPTRLRVPEGAGDRFFEAYSRIPPEERVTFLEHSVAAGETLTHIARRYGVTVDDLRAMNPTVQPRRMQIGQRVVVPKAPSVRSRLARGTETERGGEEDRLVVYRVQSGDTLSAIAAQHRVGVNDLLRWNSLSRGSVIYPGDEVKIYLPGG